MTSLEEYDETLVPVVSGLQTALADRLPFIERYTDYYLGNHPLAFATSKFREAFGDLLRALSDNWCQLVVDASVERLKVEGFRFGEGEDAAADSDAWQMWQANALDADQSMVYTESVKSGIAYVMVLPGEAGMPQITVEDPGQCICMNAPGSRRKRLAALKTWGISDTESAAVLYLPDRFVTLAQSGSAKSWQVEDVAKNAVGIVPVVPMVNNPQITGEGVSDLEPSCLKLQDAVNKVLADMIVNSEFVAYPQRFVTGLEIPTDPDGRPLDREQFLSSVSRLWVAEDPNVAFGELAGGDSSSYISQMETLVQHIAAQTRTPPHYLLGSSGSFPSGESLKATETGLVAKVRRKQITFGECWEEAMRLAFLYSGDQIRGKALDAEVIWADPESKIEAELVDSLVKMSTLGVPEPALWERWGASPQEIERWTAILAKKTAADAAAAAAAPAPVPTVPGAVPSGPSNGFPAPAGTGGPPAA